MKKLIVLATALTLAGSGGALASTVWFGSYDGGGVSNGNGHGYAYGLVNRIRNHGNRDRVRGNRDRERRIGRLLRRDRRVECLFCDRPVIVPGDDDGPSAIVPVPAAGFLLLGGLGAFALAKRRKS